MKKLFLLPLFLVFFLTGCQDNDTDDIAEPSVNEMIQGSWSRTSTSMKYYDASNTLVYDNSFNEDVYFDFDGSRLDIGHPGSADLVTVSYSFPDPQNRNRIRLVDTDGNAAEYTITTINDTKMVWEDTRENVTYDDGTGEKPANRGVFTFNFDRRTE